MVRIGSVGSPILSPQQGISRLTRTLSGYLIGASRLRERLEDPDTDRMVTKLDELQGSGRAQILQEARTILAEGTTPAIQLAIAEIERLFGYYI